MNACWPKQKRKWESNQSEYNNILFTEMYILPRSSRRTRSEKLKEFCIYLRASHTRHRPPEADSGEAGGFVFFVARG